MLEFFVHLKQLALTITFSLQIGLKPVITGGGGLVGWGGNLLVTKLLSLSRRVNVRLLIGLVKDTIFHHIVPTKLKSILAFLLCNVHLSFKSSAFIFRLHYYWGRDDTKATKLYNIILVLCFSIIKSSLMIKSTGQALCCLRIRDKAFFSIATMETLVPPYPIVFQVK